MKGILCLKVYIKCILMASLISGLLLFAGCGLLPDVFEQKETTYAADENTGSSQADTDISSDSAAHNENDESEPSDPSADEDELYTEDILGNQYVRVPEDTVLIVYDGDIEKTRSEMADALAACAESVCIKNQYIWYDVTDFYAMPYSTFWLKDCSGEGLIGQEEAWEERTSWHFYHFTYYDLSAEEIEAMKGQIDDAVSEIISRIPEDADDWQTALTVHDELCRLVSYDHSLEAPHCHDTYGALVNHEAVCSGYACAFSHIMSLLGFYSPLSYSDTHAWNFMSVPSDQAYIDVTWDDPDLTDSYGDPYIKHDCFFLTREEVESIDAHSIESMDPFVTVTDPAFYNYYYHEGYLVPYYDTSLILDMFYRQYETGSNLLSIRFENPDDYAAACSWQDGDSEEMQWFLTELGYYGSYYYWYNDNALTFSFGLYAEETFDE